MRLARLMGELGDGEETGVVRAHLGSVRLTHTDTIGVRVYVRSHDCITDTVGGAAGVDISACGYEGHGCWVQFIF